MSGGCKFAAALINKRKVTKEERKVYMREWHANHPEKVREYYLKHRPEETEKRAQDTRALRAILLQKLGGKCLICGWDDWRALQIDHIHGGGCKEKRESGVTGINYLLRLLDDPELVNKYQLLCANHNWVKRYENNEVRTA